MADTTPDISQLSSSQQEALQTYTAVTDQDPLSAISLLQRCEWNVQIAIARFYDGEPAPDPVAEAQASLPPTSARQTSNIQYESLIAASGSSPSPRQAREAVERIDTDTNGTTHYQPPFLITAFFTPLGIIYRLLSTFLSPFRFLLPAFIPRILNRLIGQPPGPTRRALPPADNARRFIREFGEEYGTQELPFVENGFNLALDNAKRDLKFLMVVLLSPNHDDNSSWVRDSLLSHQVGQFIISHKDEILLWGGNVQDSEAYRVSETLKCTKFPFVGLVCHSANVGSSGMAAIVRTAAPSATEMVAKLGSAMTAQHAQLATTRSQRSEQQASRNLRQEQDSAYERSLAQDRERARQRREEQEAQTRAEKEALAAAEAGERRQQNETQWRKWRARSIPQEPDATSKDAIRVSIRMPSGERVIRRFNSEADLEELYAFVECYDLLSNGDTKADVSEPAGYGHIYQFQLVSPMPRKVYAVDDGGTIEDRIGKGANLIVEPVKEAESDEEEVS